MNIFNSVLHDTIPLARETLFTSMSNLRDRKILLIASLAFAFLAACYLISRSCFMFKCFGMKVEDAENNIKDLPYTLERLDLSNSKNVTDETIKDLPKQLRKLNLANCPDLTDAAHQHLFPEPGIR